MKLEQTKTQTLIRKEKWVKNMLNLGACHLYPLPYVAVLLPMIFTDDPCIQTFDIYPLFMINSSSLPITYIATLKTVKEEN
jgi:hypothetical protein